MDTSGEKNKKINMEWRGSLRSLPGNSVCRPAQATFLCASSMGLSSALLKKTGCEFGT